MDVQELIDALTKIEDKTRKVDLSSYDKQSDSYFRRGVDMVLEEPNGTVFLC